MTQLAPAPQRDQARLRNELQQRASEMDLPALMSTFRYLGIPEHHITFASFPSEGGNGPLIREIHFHSVTGAATVYLSLGLLAAQTPLPSYFRAVMDDPHTRDEMLTQFIQFFDQPILRDVIMAEEPERDLRILENHSIPIHSLLHTIGLNSVCAINWLFRLVFPELGVETRRSQVRHYVVVQQPILGLSNLGDNIAFGGVAGDDASGYEVTLIAEDALSPVGTPWGEEILRRVDDTVGPLLAEADILCSVALLVERQAEALSLGSESHLGYHGLGMAGQSWQRVPLRG